MKKLYSFLFASLICLGGYSQELKTNEEPICGTDVPSAAWDAWFNKEVEKYKEAVQTGRSKMVTYTIPVIVHIIHYGDPVGTYPNISQAQVVSQINALNADYAGAGYNYTNCPGAFSSLISNTGIQFCLAVSDPSNNPLAEPGIERINAQANSWINPNTLSSTNAIKNFIDNTVKPATIWNPQKYYNIWICAKSNDYGLLGYATFPVGTSLTGIPGGFTGSATSDGVWVYAKVFGQLNGTLWSLYDKGKVLAHETGHWLGLRHMWGDGNCLTDFCNDTPWHKSPSSNCPTFPYLVNECGNGQSPNGRMFMNCMDYSDDDCMYMFTPDQTTRMQTAMSQGTYRSQLGTHGLCQIAPPPPGPAAALFSLTTSPCIGGAFTPTNLSSGGPSPSFTWMTIPSASFNPGPFVANPAITFTAPGVYTIMLTASNSLATSSYSMVVSPALVCPHVPVCIDTLSKLNNIDTLTTYNAPTNTFVLACQSGWTGFLSGTNCYKDKEFAQFFPGTTYSDTPMPQVNSVIVLFDKRGTKATPTTSATQIYFKVYGGTAGTGPQSMLGQFSDSLGVIEAETPTNQVQFCGNPNYILPGNWIIPHVVNFAAPIIIPTTGFYASVQTPYTSLQDSIRIFTSTKTNNAVDSSGWVLLNANNWRTMKYQRGAKVQFGICPQITCRPAVGMPELSKFVQNVNIVPNPNSGRFSLIFTLENREKINIKIFNCIGQEISSDDILNVSSNVFDVDLSPKPEGVYFIQISNGSEKITKKLIIAR